MVCERRGLEQRRFRGYETVEAQGVSQVEELSVDKHEFLASVMPEALESFGLHDGDLWRWRALLAVTAMVW